MQTLTSRFGDILPAALNEMTERATSLFDSIVFPSPGKVSQCEAVIDCAKTNGYAYVCFGMPDMIRVGVINRGAVSISHFSHNYIQRLFCPLIRFVDNDCLPDEFRVSEDEIVPTHFPLLFVDFVLVSSLRTELYANVVIDATFTDKYRLRNITLLTKEEG